MLVAIVLGNRLNDDGSYTELMLSRMKLALEAERTLRPDKIILSGGVANPKAGKSEAQVMFDWLKEHGVDANKMIKEDRSLTTKQNAVFSVPVALQLGATEIVVCTTPEHMHRKFLNPVKLFKAQLRNKNVVLTPCCSVADLSTESN